VVKKPPSLLEDEIDSLDDNWKLLFGHEVSHAKLQARVSCRVVSCRVGVGVVSCRVVR
jgi:hypothetical protein